MRQRGVKWFFDTAVYEMMDGFAVNLFNLFLYRLRIGGTFDNELEGYLPDKHSAVYVHRTVKDT